MTQVPRYERWQCDGENNNNKKKKQRKRRKSLSVTLWSSTTKAEWNRRKIERKKCRQENRRTTAIEERRAKVMNQETANHRKQGRLAPYFRKHSTLFLEEESRPALCSYPLFQKHNNTSKIYYLGIQKTNPLSRKTKTRSSTLGMKKSCDRMCCKQEKRTTEVHNFRFQLHSAWHFIENKNRCLSGKKKTP